MRTNYRTLILIGIASSIVGYGTALGINGITISESASNAQAFIESTGLGYARLWFGRNGGWRGSVGMTSSGILSLGLGAGDNDTVAIKSNEISFNAENSNGSALRLYDEARNLIGGLFSQRGTNEVVGILDGDNNYSYIARKDDRTDLRINNSNIFTAWKDGRVGARKHCDENGTNCRNSENQVSTYSFSLTGSDSSPHPYSRTDDVPGNHMFCALSSQKNFDNVGASGTQGCIVRNPTTDKWTIEIIEGDGTVNATCGVVCLN